MGFLETVTVASTKSLTDSFEIHLRRKEQWRAEHLGLSGPAARELGEKEFRKPEIDGFRIVHTRYYPRTGAFVEEVVVERTRAPVPLEQSVGAISEAPFCETPEDLFSIPARHCLNRLFSGWLEHNEICVTECLLSPRHLEKLMSRGASVERVIAQVASLQAGADVSIVERRGQLARLIDDTRLSAANLQTKLDKRSDDIERMISSPSDGALSTGDRLLAMTHVARSLRNEASRLAKIEYLVGLSERAASEVESGLADHFLSDILLEKGTALELAGDHRSVAKGMEWIAGAIQGGRFGLPETDRQHDFAARLVEGIGEGRLPLTKQVLLIVLETVLRENQSLDDGTAGREKTVLLATVRILSASDQFAGGPRLASRIVQRFAKFEKEGGTAGFLEAVETIVLDLNDLPAQIRLIMALFSGSSSPTIQMGLSRLTEEVLQLYGGLEHAVETEPDPERLALRLDGLAAAIERTPLRANAKKKWVDLIARALTKALSDRLGQSLKPAKALLRLTEGVALRSAAIKSAVVMALSRALKPG